MIKMLAIICLALVEPPMERVRMASHMKLVPPAKSVSLSNLKVKAMEKPMSW